MKKGKKILDVISPEYGKYPTGHWLTKIDMMMEQKNPSHNWEAYVQNFGWQKKNGTMDKFQATGARELLDSLLPQTENRYTLFELKKTGFAINNKHHMNNEGDEWYYILPACVEGFHRDWKHDGICIKNLNKKEE